MFYSKEPSPFVYMLVFMSNIFNMINFLTTLRDNKIELSWTFKLYYLLFF